MPCNSPIPAYRNSNGQIRLHKAIPDSEQLLLPCGKCLGCRQSRAREWAIRCHVEATAHHSASFTTLTYDEDHLPATLSIRHLQLWLKRLRRSTPHALRYFATGEYGEKTHRPHYHALIFGPTTPEAIDDAWNSGITRTTNISPANIAYVAGYTSKKIGWKDDTVNDRIDTTTGEVYRHQPPFILMSRRPGIGHPGKQWPQSWRKHAIYNGHPAPVPRYLHNMWKDTAGPDELALLEHEKQQYRNPEKTTERALTAAENNARAKQHQQGEKRNL